MHVQSSRVYALYRVYRILQNARLLALLHKYEPCFLQQESRERERVILSGSYKNRSSNHTYVCTNLHHSATIMTLVSDSRGQKELSVVTA